MTVSKRSHCGQREGEEEGEREGERPFSLALPSVVASLPEDQQGRGEEGGRHIQAPIMAPGLAKGKQMAGALAAVLVIVALIAVVCLVGGVAGGWFDEGQTEEKGRNEGIGAEGQHAVREEKNTERCQ